VITKVLLSKIKDLKENSNLSVTEISKVMEKRNTSLYKVLKEELGYRSNRLTK